MKLWEFKKLQNFPNYFLFYGDSFFLSIYENRVESLIQNTNIVKLYFDEWDFEKAKFHLSQNSLFGDKNTLIVKTDKFPQNLDKLVKIVGDNNFYLFFSGDAKKVKTKPFGKNFVRFFKPDLKDLIIEANNYISEKGKQIDVEHLKYLITKIDYRFLFRELDKLLILDNISNNVIDKLVFHYSETAFDELFDKIFLQQEYIKELEYLLFQGVDEVVILTSLIRYLRTIFMFNLYIKNLSHENVSKEVLGYQIPFNLENMRKKIAISIKEEKFLQLFEILLNSELEMKSSKDKVSVLFYTIISVSNLIKN